MNAAEREARIRDTVQRRSDVMRALAAVDAARVQVPGLASALDDASVARNPDAPAPQVIPTYKRVYNIHKYKS